MGVVLSVIIPTFQRMDVLPEVLRALEGQQDAPSFEVVVVDDGSGEETRRFLRSWRPAYPFRAVHQENRGPAAARNVGVEAAAAELVAFLGDDTVPRPRWAQAHWEAQRRYDSGSPRAVLGYTGWHPRIRRTAFLEWINEHGLQFGYALIEDPDDVPFNFFYTSNISLPRAQLLEEPLNEGFPYAAWEDIELSLRLTRRELGIMYEPGAVVDHDHPTDFDRFTARQERAGYSAVVFWQLHPELGGFLGLGPDGPPSLPSMAAQRLREVLVRTLQPLPVRMPRVWREALRFHYILGLRRGWRTLQGCQQPEVPGDDKDLRNQLAQDPPPHDGARPGGAFSRAREPRCGGDADDGDALLELVEQLDDQEPN